MAVLLGHFCGIPHAHYRGHGRSIKGDPISSSAATYHFYLHPQRKSTLTTRRMKLLNAQVLLATCMCIATLLRGGSAQTDTNQGSSVHLYGGDIVLTSEQQATLEATSNPNDPFAPQNAVVRNSRSLWTNGIVPFVLDGSLSQSARTAIQNAMNEYTRESCIRFRQRTTESDYVRFFTGNGCYSFIGRTGRGSQDISIGRGCESVGVVIHEIFHALGRWHEQSRPDRDQFVRINTANIQSGQENNFEITSSAFVTTQGIPYDLGSVMHYSAFAFSRNRQPTIEPVNPSVQLSSLGQRNGFSQSDIQHVNTLYCGGGSTGSWSSWTSWSGCSRTCNGGTRTRTRTCNGGTNCAGSNIQTDQCNTNSCPVAATWGTWTTWSGCSASCGGGRQSRSRVCMNGNTCVGQNAQFQNCNAQSCPGATASWASWGTWGACSATCQGGARLRRRTCQNGNNCPGSSFQIEFCNSNIPCTSQPNPNTGEWSTWSECTRSCGGGTRFRVRMCGGDNCASEQQSCNTQDCNPEPGLRGLQHVGCYNVPRFSRSLALLEGLTEDLSDQPRNRIDPVRKCGQGAQQFRFSLFSVSANYCISGSNRLSDYQTTDSTLCQDGVGAYRFGVFFMDVYQIVSNQDFQVSADAIANSFSVLTASLVTLLLSMVAALGTTLAIL